MPAPYRHEVVLLLRSTDRRITNFDRYTIKRSMLDVANPFTFSLWYSRAAASEWWTLVREVKLNGEVLVTIDGVPQLNGRIETLSIRAGRGGAVIVISGRDLAGVLVDWEADPRLVLRNKPLGEALKLLGEQHGVNVVVGSDVAPSTVGNLHRVRHRRGQVVATLRPRHQVDQSRPQPGEHTWTVMQTIAKRAGVLLWVAPGPNPNEMVVLADVPAYTAASAFQFKREYRNGLVTQDSNILDSDYHAQIRTIPTSVTAYGRAARGDNRTARHRTRVGTAVLPEFKSYSPLVPHILPPTSKTFLAGPHPGVRTTRDKAVVPPAEVAAAHAATRRPAAVRVTFANQALLDCPFVQKPLPAQTRHLHSARARNPAHGEQEARRVFAHAMRDFRSLVVTVQGHGQDVAGTVFPYAPNEMAEVRDDLIDLNEPMLITELEFEGSREGGQTTRVELGTRGAITLEPETEG